MGQMSRFYISEEAYAPSPMENDPLNGIQLDKEEDEQFKDVVDGAGDGCTTPQYVQCLRLPVGYTIVDAPQ